MVMRDDAGEHQNGGRHSVQQVDSRVQGIRKRLVAMPPSIGTGEPSSHESTPIRRRRPIPAQRGPSESVRVRLAGLWGDRWLRLAVVAGLVLLVVAPFAVYWVVYRFTHSITDDAFVETHVVNIAPQEVSGHLVRYLVQEQDVVAAGQLLAEIDPVPYREQVALLEAKLGVAQAQLAAAKTSLERLQAQVPREIEVAQRALAAAKAEQSRDEKTLQFTTRMSRRGFTRRGPTWRRPAPGSCSPKRTTPAMPPSSRARPPRSGSRRRRPGRTKPPRRR